MRIELTEITEVNRDDFIFHPESFDVFGRLDPIYSNGRWAYNEELFEKSYNKQYESYTSTQIGHYLMDDDKTAYVISLNGDIAGRILLQSSWNGYGHVEDLCVKKRYKRNGLGSELVAKGIEWGKKKGLSGLTLETQDVNLAACRFYHSIGFEIGGIDKFLYNRSKPEISHEIAVFWYYFNNKEG